jgi:hypothetical protein
LVSKRQAARNLGLTKKAVECRCKNGKPFEINGISRHPKFYPYVGKYGWNSMKVQVLTLVPNHTKEFMRLNPSLKLNLRDFELLSFFLQTLRKKLITKYHLLVAEQFCIDTLQPTPGLGTVQDQAL